MFKTNVLSSIKSILPSLHPPLPLSKRESQQLLNALTTSFRKNLNSEDGWRDDPSRLPKSRRVVSSVASAASSTTSGPSNRQSTERHLRAILSNPLFSYNPSSPKTSNSATIRRDPLEIFDEAVARGLMTPSRATGFLEDVRREILYSPSVSLSEAMAISGAGLRVVRWLQASGLERDLSFISSPGFTSVLLRFMVAEGLDERAWSWLERLMRGEGPKKAVQAGDRPRPVTEYFMFRLVEAKVLDAESLDDAYSAILRGEEMFKDSRLFVPNLAAPWCRLSWLSTVDSWRRATPSASLFDSFVNIADHMKIAVPLQRAHLDLHHPTKPNHVPAVNILRDEKHWQTFRQQLPTSTVQNPPGSERQLPYLGPGRRFVSLALDTVKLLIQEGQSEEANSIMERLRSYLGHFPEQHQMGHRPTFAA